MLALRVVLGDYSEHGTELYTKAKLSIQNREDRRKAAEKRRSATFCAEMVGLCCSRARGSDLCLGSVAWSQIVSSSRNIFKCPTSCCRSKIEKILPRKSSAHDTVHSPDDNIVVMEFHTGRMDGPIVLTLINPFGTHQVQSN